MNYLTKTREELINVVEEQKQEIETLKALLDKQISQIPNQKNTEIGESDNRLKIITESSLDAIILMDNSGNITFWNPAAETLLGYSNEEAIGQNLHKLLAPAKYIEDQEKAFEIFRQTGDGPVINKVLELEAVRRDGKEISVELSISRIKIDSKWNALGFIRDISQRKQAEISLRRSERKFQNLIENINDVVYEVDTQGNIKFISSPIERIIGYKPGEIIGKNFLDFVGENAEYLKKRLLLLNEKPEINNDYKVKSKSGEDRWVRLSTKAIIRNGKLVGGTGTLVDITPTKLIELELQKSEALYRSIMQATPDTITITDLNGHILFSSPSAMKMFGVNDPELLENKQMFDFLDKRSHPRAMEAIVEMQHGIFSGAEEYIGLKADGTSFDIEVNGDFIRDENGQPINMIFVIREISDRKKAEQALQESQNNYRRLVENINDVVFEITLNGTIKYVSPSVERIMNVKSEELIGQNFLEFVCPDDREIVSKTFSSKSFDLLPTTEYRYLANDGKIYWAHVSAQYLYDENNQIIGRSGILHDITERKLAEEKLRQSEESFRHMVENINDVVYEVGIDGMVKYVSPSIERFLGYKPEELIGQNFFDHMHEDDLSAIAQRLKTLAQRNYSFLEYRYYSKNKEIKWVRSSTNPYFADGKMIGGRGVLIDITEQKEAEEKLQQSEARYKTFFEGNNSVMLLIDPENGSIKDANPAACQYYGWSRSEICAMNISEINTLSKEELKTEINRAKDLNDQHFIFKHRLSNNEIRDVEVYSGPMQFGNSELLYSIVHDITERKQIEEKLKESEARFRMIFENVFDGISIFEENEDPLKRRLVDCNEQYAIMAGRSRDELLKVGQTYELTQTIEENANQMRLQGLTEQTAFHGSFKWLRPDGKDNTIEYIARPITWQGKQYSIGIDRDITEYKQKEEQLQKLSQAIEQSPVSIVITNLDGNIEYANPKACETTGYSVHELRGQNPRVLKSGETPSDEYQYLWESISHGNIWKGIFHNKRKNGELYWESSQISPIINEQGEIISYLAIKEDITERKRVQEELAKSENRFRQVAEQTLTVIWEVDEKGMYTYVSPVSRIVWGYDPEELINQKHFYDLHPQEGRNEFKKVALEVFQNHGVFKELINPIVTKNKTTIWVSTNGEPILDKQNKLIGYRGSDNDITARKLAEDALIASENELNYAQEIANMGSWILDLKNNKMTWSKNHYRILGLQPREKEIADDYFSKMIHPDDIHRFDQTLEKIHSSGKEASTDLRIVLPDGTIKWVQTNIVPVFEQGILVKLQGVNIDITEKKKTEESIRYQKDRLNAILKAIPDLIFIIDKQGVYLEFFASAVEKLLIKPEQIIGSNIRDAFDEKQAKFFSEKINEAITKKETLTFDYSINLPNSESVNFEARIVPFDRDKVLILSRDITEKTKKEAEIKRLSLAVEQSPISIVITDLEANIEYVNPSFEQTTGYSSQEVIGKNTNILKSGETPSNIYQNMWETIESGKKWDGEWINKKKNGDLFWEFISITPIHDSEGNIINYLAIKQDITERKRTEEILKQNEEKYRYMFVNNPQPMWIYDLETLAFLEVNGAAINHYGYSRNEFLSMTLKDIRPKEEIELLLEDVKGTTSSFNPGSEWHHIKKNGEQIDVEIVSHPIVYSGKNARHVLVNDITKRKETENKIRELNANLEVTVQQRTKALAASEKSYRQVVENVAEVIFQTDADGLWVFLNKSWEEITGFSVKESIGQLFVNYVHPEDRARNWEFFEPLIRREKDYCQHEIRYLTKDGGFRWIEVYAKLGLNENDEVIGTYGTLQDITERKLAEEALKKLSARLELALRVGGIGVWDYNVDQNNLLWDDQMFKMYGLKRDDFSSTYEAWVNGLHPDDKGRCNSEIQAAINGEKEFNSEFRIVWPDGSVHQIKALAALQKESDNARHLIGINWDVSLQKKLAEFENELLHLSPKLTGIPLSEIVPAINLALSRIGKVLNADRAYIFEFSANSDYMSNTFEWCNDGIEAQISYLQNIPSEIMPAWMDKLNQLENIIIESVTDLPDSWSTEKEILEPQGIQSLIVIPMLVENNLIGFVGLDSVKAKKVYSSTEINILKVWSSMLSSLINNQRAEKLLEQTRQNYETFFNTIDDFLWVLDQEGNIIHTNDTVKNRLEYQEEELLDRPVLMVHPEDRREEAGRIVGEMLAGISEFCPVPVVTKSGKQIPVETKVKPGFWDGKQVVFGVSKDISKIKLSEEKFSAAFQSSSAMMAISSFDSGKFIDVNQAFIQATGYQKQELIGRTIAEFGILPDANLRDSFIEKIKNGESVKEVETIYVTKNKEQRTGLLSSNSIFIGDQRCLLTVTVDITARKRAEEQLQWNKSLLEMMSNSSPLGFLVVDNTTDDILYFNKRFCQIWEIEHLEEQMLRGELKNNDIIPYCLPVLVDVPSFAESCKPLQDENNRIIVSDEIPFTNNRTIHRYSTQIRGIDDKYYGRFYIFEDVTEEKKAEEELRFARNEAEKANVAKSEFLSRMSHELRTPMNSILGFAQLLEMGELNAGQRKGVNHIMKSGKHLLDLINEVLDISRIESGRLSLSLEPVQLSSLISEMTDVIKLQAEERQIKVQLIDSESNLLFVRSDRQRLKQILLNLLNNAIKYNHESGSIFIEVQQKPDGMVRLSVTDTGNGIAPESIPKLFTPFERIGADKTSTEGTGLGLSVVKKLIEAMGGNYGVESTFGKGSTFWIELPQSESQMEKAAKSGNLEQSNGKIDGKTGTILYIEDNRSNIELIEQILSSQRADIELITDIHGKKALPLAIEHKPDLILLDLNLPDIHGSKVLEQLQSVENTRNIPVVVISADAMPQQLKKLRDAGAKDYLTKPLDIPGFLKLIQDYLPGGTQS